MNMKNALIEIIYMFAPRKRLEYYIRHNNISKVQRLLAKGVDPNPTKKQIRNAHMKPFLPLLFKALRCPSEAMLHTLLEHNANPYATYCRMKFYGQEWYSFEFEDVGILEYFLARLRSPLANNSEPEAQKNVKIYKLLRAYWQLDDKLHTWVMAETQEYSPLSFALFKNWEEELLLHQQNTRILESINNAYSDRARRKM